MDEDGGPAITEQIKSLSLLSLRVELLRRNLLSTGLRPALETRLQKSLSTNPFISVPSNFPPRSLPAPPPPCRPIATGILRHRSVWITGDATTARIWKCLKPGKANLSRLDPLYLSGPATAQGRAQRQLHQLSATAATCAAASRTDVEHIQISLVEAYYLAYIRGVLLIQLPDGKLLRDGHRAWRLFVQRKPRFGMLFVAYVRYRAMGWRPRSGLKYGVDWVLYPADTAHHQHSPFCVVLRMEGETERGMMESSWIRLQNRLRLVKNVSKSLIIAQLSTTNAHVAHDSSLQNALSTVCIREITVDRWVR